MVSRAFDDKYYNLTSYDGFSVQFRVFVLDIIDREIELCTEPQNVRRIRLRLIDIVVLLVRLRK